MNCLITVPRSEPDEPVAVSRSAQSSSLMRTDRCCVTGLFGTAPSLPGVRTDFNGTSLRCTYTESTFGVRTPSNPAGSPVDRAQAQPSASAAASPSRPPPASRTVTPLVQGQDRAAALAQAHKGFAAVETDEARELIDLGDLAHRAARRVPRRQQQGRQVLHDPPGHLRGVPPDGAARQHLATTRSPRGSSRAGEAACVAPETATVIIDPACEYWLERTDDDPGEDEPTD